MHRIGRVGGHVSRRILCTSGVRAQILKIGSLEHKLYYDENCISNTGTFLGLTIRSLRINTRQHEHLHAFLNEFSCRLTNLYLLGVASENVRDVDFKRLLNELVRSVRTLNRAPEAYGKLWVQMSTSDDPLKILSDFVRTRSSVDEIRSITKNVLNEKRSRNLTSFYMNLLRNLRTDILMTFMLDDICRVFFPILFGQSDNGENEEEYVPILIQRFDMLLQDDDKGTIRKRCHDVFERCADLVSPLLELVMS